MRELTSDESAIEARDDGAGSRVRTALIDAACELLAERGPQATSLRDIATLAGVNHGQVHHYFGGKQGLIDAAIEHLARQHFANARERAAGQPIPPPLTLAEDAQYLKTMVRLVLEGDLATATREIEAGVSVPDAVRQYVTRDYAADAVPIELKARLALAFALEMGWAALEPFVLKMAGVKAAEADEVRASARVLAEDFFQALDATTSKSSK